MSKFFPWGFKAGKKLADFPGSGCPLEDHLLWKHVHGATPSNMCWASTDGGSIRGAVGNGNYANLAYDDHFHQDGIISCVVEKVVTVAGHYVLPIAGRMLNWNNFIGARTAQGKYEVIDKVGGTYHTLYSAGVPAVGDTMALSLTGQNWKLEINGTELSSGTTNLAIAEGWWGCSSHAVADGDVLVSGITIVDTTNYVTHNGEILTHNGERIIRNVY